MADGRLLASGDGGDDGHLVAGVQRRLEPGEKANVLAVDVEVDEAPKLAALIAQANSDLGEATLQVAEGIRHAATFDADFRLPGRDAAQRRRDANTNTQSVLLNQPATTSPSIGSTRTPCSLAQPMALSISSSSPAISRMTQPRSRVTLARRMLVTTWCCLPMLKMTGCVTRSGGKVNFTRRLAMGASVAWATAGSPLRRPMLLNWRDVAQAPPSPRTPAWWARFGRAH